MSEWISVKDKLPENIDGESKNILFYDFMKEESFKGFYDFFYHRFCDMDHEEYKFVTHWMPLPEPPK